MRDLTELKDEMVRSMEDTNANTDNQDFVKRGAWEDFKNSVRKAGQKIKSAFGKRQDQGRQFEEKMDLEAVKRDREQGEELIQHSREDVENKEVDMKKEDTAKKSVDSQIIEDNGIAQDDAATFMRSISKAPKEDTELKKRFENVILKMSKALKKKEMANRKREEEDEREALRVSTRGKWDDFKEELKKMKFKMKEKMGKRSNLNLETIKRDLSDLQAIQNALAQLKQDAIDQGMENEPDILQLIEETEELAHQLESKHGQI